MVTTAMYLQIPSDGLLQEDARHFSDPIPFPESQIGLANARWMNSPDIPLDMGGPVDRPFAPMGAGFADVPAIEHGLVTVPGDGARHQPCTAPIW